jgi:hypothetical protein
MTSPYDHSHDAELDSAMSASAIRADIARTRERLGATVEALGAQLNPSNLKQRVKDSVREATIGKVQHMASNTTERITETGRGLAQVIRDNPLPAAVAAAGLGWLILSSRDQRDTRRFASSEPYGFENPGESGTSKVREGMRNVADTVADKAHDLTERAGDATQRVVEKAKSAGDIVAEKADAAVQSVQERTRSGTRRIGNQFEDTPIGMGAVALALGLAIGMSVPATRKEVALMGDARDKLLDKTRERVADTTERVERVVERALPDVKNVVRDAAREVREAARDEGLSA